MKTQTMSLRNKVEAIVNDTTLTDYRIAKELGIYVNSVSNFRKGDGDISNMRLEFAERYADFYDRLQLMETVEAESKE